MGVSASIRSLRSPEATKGESASVRVAPTARAFTRTWGANS
jgi:hypothetical protein